MKGGYVRNDTCWFNPERKLNDSGIIPTYEVHNFEELEALLKQRCNKNRQWSFIPTAYFY